MKLTPIKNQLENNKQKKLFENTVFSVNHPSYWFGLNSERRMNKKAMLRILEAFIGIMLILSVVLILMYQQRNDFSNQDEIARLQRDILNFISKDDALRGQILSNQLYGTDEKVKLLMPYGYQYYLKLCNYNDICSLGCYVKGEVYSYETLIVANLTYYVPEQAKKLKLFMWYGAWPDGCARSNYTRPGEIVLPELPGVANLVPSFTFGTPYTWLNPSDGVTYIRINWTINVQETAGVNWYIRNFTRCWTIPPVSFGGKPCLTDTYSDNSRNATKDKPYIKESYAGIPPIAQYAGDIYNFTYGGQDANGNVLSTPVYTIQFP